MGNKIVMVLIAIFTASFFSAKSQGIPIQLMIVDSNGFEKVNHNVKLRLSLQSDTSVVTGQYQEVHVTQSNEFGIVSTSLGNGVPTTNSSVLSLSQFSFSADEPLIKVELDTTVNFNQYYTAGYVGYHYPIVARRALKADSSTFAQQSQDSYFSDTAEFARNFDESYDGDTSDSNELQSLIRQGDYLKLTKSEDSVIIRVHSSQDEAARIAASNPFCIQGEPEIFSLEDLESYGTYLTTLAVFDSIGYFMPYSTGSYWIVKYNFQTSTILATQNYSSSPGWVVCQNDSVGVIFDRLNSLFYVLDNSGKSIDTVSYSGNYAIAPFVTPDNRVSWRESSPNYFFTYNINTGAKDSVSFVSPGSTPQPIGNDSILWDGKIYNRATMSILRTLNIAGVSTGVLTYQPEINRITYHRYVSSSNYGLYSCDLTGGDERIIGGASQGTSPSRNRINGKSILTIQGGKVVNGYAAAVPKVTSTSSYYTEYVLFDFDTNGVIPFLKYTGISFKEFGRYTANYSFYWQMGQCIAGQYFSSPQLIRFNKR